MIFAGAAAASILMAILWVVARRTGNMAVVDVGWTICVAGLGVLAGTTATPPARGAIIAAMAAVWGVRLATHLMVDRVLGAHRDGRYDELAKTWGAGAFFVFFQAQALLAVLLSAPFWLAARAGGALHPLELVAPALLAVAITGEALADAQLRRFKKDPGSRGKTCRAGLWRYSRHPNYFFEWLAWIAFAMAALPAPLGWLGLASPAVMLALLFRVTGIPATEAQALRTRGDDYRRYQVETSVFVPWFPRTRKEQT